MGFQTMGRWGIQNSDRWILGTAKLLRQEDLVEHRQNRHQSRSEAMYPEPSQGIQHCQQMGQRRVHWDGQQKDIQCYHNQAWSQSRVSFGRHR